MDVCSSVKDPHCSWGSLPTAPLSAIFRRILEHFDAVADMVKAHSDLSLVCKHWQNVARTTPVCLALSAPSHATELSMKWLSNVSIESLVLDRPLVQRLCQVSTATAMNAEYVHLLDYTFILKNLLLLNQPAEIPLELRQPTLEYFQNLGLLPEQLNIPGHIPLPAFQVMYETACEVLQHDEPNITVQQIFACPLLGDGGMLDGAEMGEESEDGINVVEHDMEDAQSGDDDDDDDDDDDIQGAGTTTLMEQNEPQGLATQTGMSFMEKLFSNPNMQRNSKDTLVSVIHATIPTAPLLSPFQRLRQVSLSNTWDGEDGEPLPGFGDLQHPPPAVDLIALSSLPDLCCLALHGEFQPLQWENIPTTLRHLTVNVYQRRLVRMPRFPITHVRLPSQLASLECLSVKGAHLVVNWPELLRRCEEVYLTGYNLSLIVDDKDLGECTSEEIITPTDRFARSLAAASASTSTRVQVASLTFSAAATFCSADQVMQDERSDGADMAADDLLADVRRRALLQWDIDPIRCECESFVNDTHSSTDVCVLKMERQQANQPRNCHFTRPIGDLEKSLLRGQPAKRLIAAGRADTQIASVLLEPDVLAQHASTLTHLGNFCIDPPNFGVPISIDLTSFAALRSLNAVFTSPASLQQLSLPEGLTSIELELPLIFDDAELDSNTIYQLERSRFDARILSNLRHLKSLTLLNWYKHDLYALPAHVHSVSMYNPRELFDSNAATWLFNPAWADPTVPLGPKTLRGPAALCSRPGVHANEQPQLGWWWTALRTIVSEASDAAAPVHPTATAAALESDGRQNHQSANVCDVDESSPEHSCGALPLYVGPPPKHVANAMKEKEVYNRRRQRRHRCMLDRDDGRSAAWREGYDSDEVSEDEGQGALAGQGVTGSKPSHTQHHECRCTDPNCPVRTNQPHLRINFCAYGLKHYVDMRHVLETGYPLITLDVDQPTEIEQQGVCLYLLVGESWDAFVDLLRKSSLRGLQLSIHCNELAFVNHMPSNGFKRHHSLFSGLQALQKELTDVFEFRTAMEDGELKQGVEDSGEIYGMLRRQPDVKGTS